MCDYSELKPLLDACRAENCNGHLEFQKAVEALFDVCTVETIAGLIAENERLRAGMKGDYDLDAWLDWAQEADGLRKNADRYQWLRGRDLETVRDGGIFAGMTPENVILNGLDLDQRIDYAITMGEQS